jgi:hypothetical protein
LKRRNISEFTMMNIGTLFLKICLNVFILITLWNMSIKSPQRDRIMNIFTGCVSYLQEQWNQTMPTVTYNLAMTAECWWEAFEYLRAPGHPIGRTWDWYYKTFHTQFVTNWYLEYKILQISVSPLHFMISYFNSNNHS